MIQEPFAAGNSRIHHLDPRFKIIAAIIYTMVIALSNTMLVLIIALCISILLVYLAGLNLREVAKRLAVVGWFLLFIWLILPLAFEGKHLYQIGPLSITLPGVMLATRITIKTAAILLAFMPLVTTMTIITLGHALNCLHLSGKFIHLLMMTYRYLFVIENEYQRLWNAIKIRGFCPKTNMHSYKTYAYLIGMLFVRASIRAERVHQAMLCRGFDGRFYSLYDFSVSRSNWIFAGFMTIITLALIILELS